MGIKIKKLFAAKPKEDKTPEDKVTKEMTDALSARSTMFKGRPKDIDTCAWYVRTVTPEEFCFKTASDLELPEIFGERAFEYAATWVEHYYYELVQECRSRNKLGLVKMLYHWYIAQFTIDYLNDVFPLTSEQYLESSGLVPLPENGLQVNSRVKYPCMIEAIKMRKVRALLVASREQMKLHEAALGVLPDHQATKIREALDGFYKTVVKQFGLSQKELFDSMNLKDYYAFRTLNAGGEMGFIRQTFVFSLVDPTAPVGTEEFEELGRMVGRNIALINDVYGLKKDILTGDVNIILKHQHENKCSLDDSIKWGTDEIVKTVRFIEYYYAKYPHTVETKYNVAMGCVSGNHGAHATCKRFELPQGYKWPESL